MRTAHKIFLAQHDRPDTYTGKLGFVLDEQTSVFKSWTSKSKNPIKEIYNVPTSGFVLNKVKKGHVHDFGRTKDKVRIWDPRGFEVELLNENILRLINDCGIEKGGYISEKLVYFWKGKGTQVMLLPETSEEYQRFLQGYKTLKKSTYVKKSANKIQTNNIYYIDYLENLEYFISDKICIIDFINGQIKKYSGYIKFYYSNINNKWVVVKPYKTLPSTTKKITYLKDINTSDFVEMNEIKVCDTLDTKLSYELIENEYGSHYMELDNGDFIMIKDFKIENIAGVVVTVISKAIYFRKEADDIYYKYKYSIDEKYSSSRFFINDIYKIDNIQQKLNELITSKRYNVNFK